MCKTDPLASLSNNGNAAIGEGKGTDEGGQESVEDVDVSMSASPDMDDEMKRLDWADEAMPIEGVPEGERNARR